MFARYVEGGAEEPAGYAVWTFHGRLVFTLLLTALYAGALPKLHGDMIPLVTWRVSLTTLV